MKNRAICWFKNDLRTTDNPMLTRALEENDEVIPVVIFDDRWWAIDRWGMRKTGAFRTQFLIESVADLAVGIDALGGSLVVRKGNAAAHIAELATRYSCSRVYVQAAHTAEELQEQREVAEHVTLINTVGASLFHPDDLPMKIEDLPASFTPFRIAVEKHAAIRRPLPEPEHIPVPSVAAGVLPTLADFEYSQIKADDRAALNFSGGSGSGWERINHYFWETGALSEYKITRNRLMGANFSSKLSPWLAVGGLSPREVAAEVQRYETERGANESTYWLIFELMWRDYFMFVAMKFGNRIFHRTGLKGRAPSWSLSPELFARWADGRTGHSFVDANMRELVATGFMSNRGRQNVASYLVHDLGVDWRLGASLFEHYLIDHDPASNYGNWLYVAGVGNDPREGRKFNVDRQAAMYDPDGSYRTMWCS